MGVCTDIGLTAALHTWWEGEKLDGFCIWGHTTVSIGRFAKVLALLASATILLDILGEERIYAVTSRFSNWLRAGVRRVKAFMPWTSDRLDVLASASSKTESVLFGCYAFFIVTGLLLAPIYFVLDIASSIHQIVQLVFGKSMSLGTSSLSFWLDCYGLFCTAIAAVPFIILLILRFAALIFANNILCWYARCVAAVLLIASWSLDMFASS